MKPAEARMALAAILHLTDRQLDAWLGEHRRGLEPCPADVDWLTALQTADEPANAEDLRRSAVQAATIRINRRHAIAARHRQKRAAKLHANWQMGKR